MARVKYGVTYPRSTALDVVEPASLAENAEGWGYDSFWVPDLLTTPDLDPLVILSGAATRTKYIRLGTSVLILPARPPVQLAKTALSLDAMSNGRLILGTGLGILRTDLRAAQVGHISRAKLNDEALDVLRLLVHETNVSYQGEYFNFDSLTILPRPVREDSLPIWTSAYWDGKVLEGPLRRAGRFGDGFLNRAPPRLYKECKDKISDYAASFGRDPEAIEWGCLMYGCIGPSREDAWQTLSSVIRQGSGREVTDGNEGCYAFGSVDDCIEGIQRYIDVGLTHIVISMKCPAEQLEEMYEAFAKEVLPRVR